MAQKQEIIKELLTRGVERIIVRKHLEERLLKGEKLRLKLGIDPTGVDLHIGHMVAIRKLREFQELGHKIIIIVGDYTARIGDPTDRDKMREPLTQEQVYENLKTYKKQIGKILDVDKTQFAYQSEWFDKTTLRDIFEWTGIFTVQQMLDRDMYQRRMKEGSPISIQEFLYPLMQGYDSIAIRADVEFGGSDQEFNLLVGRTMQEHFTQPPQDILTTSLLLGTDGRKMSKTYGNYIGVMDSPKEMFGKVMSAIDNVIVDYFTLCTDMPLAEINKIARGIEEDGGLNPRDAKAHLAREIVTIYHSAKAAREAEAEFDKIFKQKEKPSDIPLYKPIKSNFLITDLLVVTRLASSKAEARRLVEQKGVKVDDAVVDDWKKEIAVRDGMVVQVGKRKFMKITR